MPSPEPLRSAHEAYWWRLVSLITRHTGNADLAEEAVASAFEQAVKTWSRDGVPESRFAWLVTAAKNQAIDAIRKESRRQEREQQDLAVKNLVAERGQVSLDDEIHLMALAAHPSLSTTSATCMILRNISGVTTSQLAAIYGVADTTMAARLTRAKKQLHQYQHELYDLSAEDLRSRIPTLRATLYAAWALAHTQVDGHNLRDVDLAQATLRLVRKLAAWEPSEENQSLTAICEYATARWQTRQPGGLPHSDQHTLENAPRKQWNWKLVVAATERLQPVDSASGEYRWRAEIERLLTCRTWQDTPWQAIISAYENVLTLHPDPATALARSVAISYAYGAQRGLADLRELLDIPEAQPLLTNPYTPAAQADMLTRCGDTAAAKQQWLIAADLARTAAEQHYFQRRAAESHSD